MTINRGFLSPLRGFDFFCVVIPGAHAPGYALSPLRGFAPIFCRCGRSKRALGMKIFEIKEDMCYVMSSVAGQRGRLLFSVDAVFTTSCETGAPQKGSAQGDNERYVEEIVCW